MNFGNIPICRRTTYCKRIQGPGQVWRLRYHRALCRSLACLACGPSNRAEVRKQVEEAVQRHKLWRQATLTLSTHECPPARSAKHIKKALKKLFGRIRRAYGPFQYLWVLEYTDQGMAHLHVLVDIYIKQDWLSKAWVASGGGKIVDIRRVQDLERTAWYITDDLAQTARHVNQPRYSRCLGSCRKVKLHKTDNWKWWGKLPWSVDHLRLSERARVVRLRRNEFQRLVWFEVPA